MSKKGNQAKSGKKYRAPIVALLGHVDHGKTSILDKIRKSAVQESEEGGITQGISVYTVSPKSGDITFIDTPGHEAFDLMRTRGGDVADIVLLVVAANDGVKPQTKESIEIIKNTKKPHIVVLNKVDIAGIDIEKVKRDLATEGIAVESMGGDVPCVEVSAKTGKGIDDLLEMIGLVSEVSGISTRSAGENIDGRAVVLESMRDKCKGNVSTIVVTAGKFARGKFVAYRDLDTNKVVVEKIRGFVDERGRSVEVLEEGYGGLIIGLGNKIGLGEAVFCLTDKNVDLSGKFDQIEEVQEGPVDESQKESAAVEGDETTDQDLLSLMLGNKTEDEELSKQSLKVILRANSQGTMDAIMKSLEKLNKDGGNIEIISAEVGNISLNDVELAANLGAIVIGFRVRIDAVAAEFAKKNRILAKVYAIIYELVDEIGDAADALLEPDEVEEDLGNARVKKIFELSDGSKVYGLRVESGELKSGARCRILRNGEPVTDGKITSMKCEKDAVNEAGKGADCGVMLDTKESIEEGDIFECYRIVKN